MSRFLLIFVLLLIVGWAGMASAETWVSTGSCSSTKCGWGGNCGNTADTESFPEIPGNNYYNVTVSATGSFNFDCMFCTPSCTSASSEVQTSVRSGTISRCSAVVCCDGTNGRSTLHCDNLLLSTGEINVRIYVENGYGQCCPTSGSGVAIISNDIEDYTVSGQTGCIAETIIYVLDGESYHYLDSASGSSYSFRIYNGLSYRLTFDGTYYDFTCDAENVVFDYDACIYVYGYTCGVDTVKLYKDDGGWSLDDSVGQSTGYDVYEMPIEDGGDYKISFIDSGTEVHNQTFSCTGDHVLIDYDRCKWVYSSTGPPFPIYLWTGYDYNIVIFKDVHGNMVENADLAVYDTTDNTYVQKWTGNSEGYALLGTKFDTDHDVLMMLRTFDGVFTLDTTYPANGSALVGEENITTTNWTIPIKYNLNVLPVDQYGMALFDVFCGLSEYTPLNPQAFWGMDLSDQGYVPVTNCSGFAMCDIIAEKEGYTDYKVEALNWTSKSALVKDYRHNVVMEEE